MILDRTWGDSLRGPMGWPGTIGADNEPQSDNTLLVDRRDYLAFADPQKKDKKVETRSGISNVLTLICEASHFERPAGDFAHGRNEKVKACAPAFNSPAASFESTKYLWRWSKIVYIDDSCGEGLRGLLRQVVSDTACDGPVRIFAGEFVGIGAGVRMRRTVGIAFKGNGGHRNDRIFRKPPVKIGILGLAFS